MTSVNPFPSYIQLPTRVPQAVWYLSRAVSVLGALGLSALLIADPPAGLKVWWSVMVPLLPLLWFVAPGLWRNICPLAATNQAPRLFGFTRGLTAPGWFREYAPVAGIVLFIAFGELRDRSCSTPPGPGQRATASRRDGWGASRRHAAEGQERLVLDDVPAAAGAAHLRPDAVRDGRRTRTASRASAAPRTATTSTRASPTSPTSTTTTVISRLPALLRRRLPGPRRRVLHPARGAVHRGGLRPLRARRRRQRRLVLLLAQLRASVAAQAHVALRRGRLLEPLLLVGSPVLADALLGDGRPIPLSGRCARRCFRVAVAWLARTWRKEGVFVETLASGPGQPIRPASGSDALAAIRKRRTSRHARGHVRAGGHARRAQARPVAARGRRGLRPADRGGLPDGHVRRGPDRGHRRDGEPEPADRRRRARRWSASAWRPNTRMACCARVQGPVTVSPRRRTSVGRGEPRRGVQLRPAVERVVIIGNGIAGVTAADHMRRRHPECAIDLVARASRITLYNRMGITRLIYGRSAMTGAVSAPRCLGRGKPRHDVAEHAGCARSTAKGGQ